MLVVGGTGNVGRKVVADLTVAGVRTRALIRDPAAAGLPPEVDVVRGDLADPGSLAAATDRVESVLLIWPFHDTENAERAVRALSGPDRRLVSDLTGRPARDIRDWAVEHAAEFR
ncbi:SDR family oxidoreductase [Nocardia sp. NPDC004151]|uniref:SDR family oxidoreductase n=1 Tax=Nocardia sp. NPDC004151 TaxID=3364304 RepID=UPI0036A9E180